MHARQERNNVLFMAVTRFYARIQLPSLHPCSVLRNVLNWFVSTSAGECAATQNHNVISLHLTSLPGLTPLCLPRSDTFFFRLFRLDSALSTLASSLQSTFLLSFVSP